MTEYHKIPPVFKKHTEGPNRNQAIIGAWSRPEFDVLQNAQWHWTEKLDGMNIRIIWDGHRMYIGGRTDDAMFKPEWTELLTDTFPEDLVEQQFGGNTAVLYGELFGKGIQNGGNYGDLQFALFDVRVGKWWLQPENVEAVATGLGVKLAPVYPAMDLMGAVVRVSKGVKSAYGDFWAEGLIGRAPLGITARNGDRLIVKVKHRDLYGR